MVPSSARATSGIKTRPVLKKIYGIHEVENMARLYYENNYSH